MSEPRWLRSEPIQRKQTWKPSNQTTLVPWAPPVGKGEGDSEYGNFDPVGYGYVDPEEEQRRLRERMLADSPFPTPEQPPQWSPPAQPPDVGAITASGSLTPGNSELQGAVQADDRGWPGQVADTAQGWSQGLASALQQAPQAISGALQAADESPIWPTNWAPIKATAEGLQKFGGEAAGAYGKAAQEDLESITSGDPGRIALDTLARPAKGLMLAGQAANVVPAAVGAGLNTLTGGQPMTSPEGQPMGLGDVASLAVDPFPGAHGALIAAGVLPDLATHANPAIRATQRMLKEAEPAGPPSMDMLENFRRGLVQHWTDRGVHLAKAQELAQKALDLKQMPDGMNPAELARLMPDPAAEVHVNEGLKPIAQAAGELYDHLGHILVNSDNIDVARNAGIKARDEVLKSAPPPKISEELSVDRRRAGQLMERLEGQLADVRDRVYSPSEYFLHTASSPDLHTTGIDYSFPGGRSPVWMTSEGRPYTRGGGGERVYGIRKDLLDPSKLDTEGPYPKYNGAIPPEAIVDLGEVPATGGWTHPVADISPAQQLKNQKAMDALGLQLNKAQDRFNALNKRWQETEVAHEQAIRHKAAAAQADAELGRVFPGGVNVRDSEGALQRLEQELGPERWARLQRLAQMAWSYADGLRERMVQSGVWAPELVEHFRQNSPHYIPTNITDFMGENAVRSGGAKNSLSVTDDLLRKESIKGTERAREDPIAALVRATYEVERVARRNDTFNAFLQVRNASPQLRELIREVPTAGWDVLKDLTPEERALRSAEHRAGESLLKDPKYVSLKGFVEGKPVTYAMPKTLAEVIQGEPTQVMQNGFGDFVRATSLLFVRSATTRFPVFLAGNAVNDATSYIIRESARSGRGPAATPRALADLAVAYWDVFKPGSGISRGEFRGDAARFLKQGGGQFGFYSGSLAESRKVGGNLQRGAFWEIKSPKDIARLTFDTLTLKPVEAVGSRIEMAPRLAAFRRAERRGLSPTNATIAGRDVSIDFARGGDWAKIINQFVPFFNVGIQGAVTPVRAGLANPFGTMATAAGLVGIPTMVAEAWNRGHNFDGSYDPQRAKDYADVPDYAKQTGIVIMLPNSAPVNAEGTRKPEYVYGRLREWAPAAVLAREVAARYGGSKPTGWQELLGQTLSQAGPVHGPSDMLPFWASTPIELAADTDFFRGGKIATQGQDERASALGQAVSGPLTGLVQRATGNPYNQVHPSQVDFALRGMGAGLAGTGLGLSNIAAGKTNPQAAGITAAPIVGGLASRFFGNATGQRLRDINDNPLPVDMMKTLRDAGISERPEPPPSTMSVPGMPGSEMKLRPEQREEYNRLFQVIFNSLYSKMPEASKTSKESLAGTLSEARQQTSTAFPLGLTPEQIKTQATFDGKPPTDEQKLAIDLAADLRDPKRFPEYINPQSGQAEGGPDEWSAWDQALQTKEFNGVRLTDTQLAGLRDRKREALTRKNLQLFQIDVDAQGAVTGVRPRDPRYEAWNRHFGTFQGIDDTYIQAWKDGRRARYVNPQTGEQVTPAQSDMMDNWLRMYRDSRVGSKLRAALRPKALMMQNWATPDWRDQLRKIDEAELQGEAGITDLREAQFAGTAP